MAQRRIRVRSSNQGSGRTNARKSSTKAGKKGGKEVVDLYWEAQQQVNGEREENRAPQNIHIDLTLDAGTQFKTVGGDVVIMSSVGYTIRFRLRDDPNLFKKLMQVVDGMEVTTKVNEALDRAADRRKAKETSTEARSESSRKGRPQIVGQKGGLTPEKARRSQAAIDGRRKR